MHRQRCGLRFQIAGGQFSNDCSSFAIAIHLLHMCLLNDGDSVRRRPLLLSGLQKKDVSRIETLVGESH